MIVIGDTAPLHYLVLVGEADLLPVLYGEVFIPEAVVLELNASGTPAEVARWLATPPAWLVIRRVTGEQLALISADLDEGEREAIALAREVQADLVLMDDQAGRNEARRWKLRVTAHSEFYLDEELVRAVLGQWLPE